MLPAIWRLTSAIFILFIKLLDLHMVMRSVATEDVWNKNVTNLLASDNRRNLYFRVVGEERNKSKQSVLWLFIVTKYNCFFLR